MFTNGTTQQEFLQALDEASHCNQICTEQRKSGESLVTVNFVSKLKKGSQWERWQEELKSVLGGIIGLKGINLTYAIRIDEIPNLEEQETWEERARVAARLDGPEYRQDRKLVHQFILRNISEDSDAYTYIKSKLEKENGREDIIALRYRYKNIATR